jgi:serine/threonine protein kinase
MNAPTEFPPVDDLPDDPRLLQAVQEYLDQLEAGHRPNRQDLLRRHPDIAEPLARCLDGLELVHKAAGKDEALSEPSTGTAPKAAELPPAKTLGDFRIVREIGRGGMGIVYEAVQLSLDRRVALKVLPFAATFDAKHLQRFRNEAHAAAQLHHTNIVPVYAVGSERGVHFYAMQLIDGQSLAVVVRQLRQQAGHSVTDEEGAPPKEPIANLATASYPPSVPPVEESPRPETISGVSLALSTQRSGKREEFFRTAAGFIVQAAEALEHAHQFGIVHRDIKPANLLVDVHGRLWITDFGLAQFHADAGLTQTGDILGTLRYMSPEQASGQRVLLDHRTDVYSLGATLYELATLEPIFPGQNRQELLHQIIKDEPRAPRAVDRAVPVELETIILKAVSKNPADRYASAKELASDLRLYLEHKPILARRPSPIERARKWSRRHPDLVAAGVLLLLVCTACLLVSNRMIADEKTKTVNALNGERQRAEEAEKRYQQARQVVDLLVQVGEEELAYTPPPLQKVRKRLLETALNYYQDFIVQQQGNPDAQAELTEGKDRVRRILDDLSTLEGAYQLVLVRRPDVQRELDLTSVQRDQVARLLGEQWFPQREEHFRGPQRSAVEEDRQGFLTLARQNEKALAEILNEQQLRRLEQMALQSQGHLAFYEKHVIDALQLTAEQQQKIRRIEAEIFGKMSHGPRGKGGRGGHPHPMEEYAKQAAERILLLLDEEQKVKWRELTGEPFTGAISCTAPPGSFGPR